MKPTTVDIKELSHIQLMVALLENEQTLELTQANLNAIRQEIQIRTGDYYKSLGGNTNLVDGEISKQSAQEIIDQLKKTEKNNTRKLKKTP